MQNFQSKGIRLLKINFTKDKPITKTKSWNYYSIHIFVVVKINSLDLDKHSFCFLTEKMQITCITWICLQCDKDIVCKVFT